MFIDVGEDVTTVWAQMQAEADRYLGNAQGSVTRVAALYFPSEDGNWLVPETREVTFGEDGCARALVDALCAGPAAALSCARALFAHWARCWRAIRRSPSPARGSACCNSTSAAKRSRRRRPAGVQMWQVCGALTLTLCSFYPELDAVRLNVDGVPVVEGAARGTRSSLFDESGLRRRDLSGYIGSVARLYLADAAGELVLREGGHVPGRGAVAPRALLAALFSTETARRPRRGQPCARGAG